MDLVFCNLKLKAFFTDNTEDALSAPRGGLRLLRQRRHSSRGQRSDLGASQTCGPEQSHFPCCHSSVYSFVKRGVV